MNTIIPAPLTIQTSPESVPTVPLWFGEVAVFGHVLTQLGILKAIQENVQFARARFGKYEVIDFVAVLWGYALSGEPTLEAFYLRLTPFADPFMALFGRFRLPHRATLSRFLAALDQPSVEALRIIFQKDVVARSVSSSKPGGLWDRQGNHWLVMDVDGTKQAARQRALPDTPDLPPAYRRFEQVCAPGYLGRKRGEVARTRTTVLQSHTHQWVGTYGGAGNGDYRGELRQAVKAISAYATACAIPLSQILVRVDGLYGNAAPLVDVLGSGLGVIVRGKDYHLLDLPIVQAVLDLPPDQICTHPESGATRALYDCPDVPLTPAGPLVRLIVASYSATSTPHKIGKKRDDMVYEVFVTRLAIPAFSAKDVLDLYLHRGSFETVLADEDREQDSDRWVSHTPCGQECFQIISQWVWNLRLELGQHLSPTAMRTTEFAPALGNSPAPVSEPVVVYGPPQWARPSFTGGFPGAAFALQPDGTLRCPANHPLYAQERRTERDGSYRLLYSARIGDCRICELRAQCQESPSTSKPRRVSAIFWPVSSPEEFPSAPVLGPPEPLLPPIDLLPHSPVLWRDWPRCQIRRTWLKVIHSETVVVAMEAAPTEKPMAVISDQVMTRAQRAHWRLSWLERFSRNARPSTAQPLTVTIHGLPDTFALAYGFALLATA